ncbi:GNAT family N-acetyltransferase [Hominifimenecus sp. rT4P-3]|uniref:GNAT family N-acetyltransferase n=1 Tax=Hominifimenecus sp. rT4P-3 TaxID=3242979 RepID=UPI003DA491C4
MIYEMTNTQPVFQLFGQWEETILWSCLQKVMGKIYADDPEHPTAAMAILGDFSFFAGKPNIELVSYKPSWCIQDFIIMIPQNKAWQNTILQVYQEKAKVVSRYATKKEDGIFHKEKLEEARSLLPSGYEICRIDEPLYHLCRSETWSTDLVSQFPTYKDYRRLGLGVVIQKNHTLVAGASSYSRYQGGIEIEIDTKEEYRRKGFAYLCGSQLILECLKQDLYPSWDAQNKISLSLAEKLGYHYSHTYPAIEIWGYAQE